MNFKQRFIKIGFLGGDDPIEAVFLWICALIWLPYMVSGSVMILLSIVLLSIPSVRKKILRDRTTAILVLAIGGLSVFSALLYRNMIGVLVGIAVPLTFVMWFFMSAYANRKIYEKCSVMLGIGLLAATVAAVFQYFVFTDYQTVPRSAGGAFNPNYFGTVTALAITVFAIRLFDPESASECSGKKPIGQTVFFAMVIPVGIFALLLSRSRSAIISAVITFMILGGMLLKKRFLVPILFIGGAFLTLAWMNPGLLNRPDSIFSSLTEVRFPIWKEAVHSWMQDVRSILIGRGPLTARIAVYSENWNMEAKESIAHAHNLLLDGLLNVGVIGTALYAVLFYRLMKPIVVLGRRKKRSYAFCLGVGAIAQSAVQGLVDVTLFWHQTALLFFWMLCFSAAEGNGNMTEPSENGCGKT